jgi:hypothetical protein
MSPCTVDDAIKSFNRGCAIDVLIYWYDDNSRRSVGSSDVSP